MTLTPEQFNKLALKEDLKDFYTKVEMDKKFDQVLISNDKLMKKLDNIEHAFVSNLAAHDRFEKRLVRIEKHLNLGILFDY
ncbi:MAG: hypothetical protein HYV53_02455 [Parcubacteria group bacterium]|nr:hypothetical protein [Parcubacteria group bacterium]